MIGTIFVFAVEEFGPRWYKLVQLGVTYQI